MLIVGSSSLFDLDDHLIWVFDGAYGVLDGLPEINEIPLGDHQILENLDDGSLSPVAGVHVEYFSNYKLRLSKIVYNIG